MARQSAGILLFRKKENDLEFFLVHPGGPFWAKKDAGAWSIPKGEFAEDEEPLMAALREFEEETGSAVEGNFIELKPIKQKSGKVVFGWGVEGDIDAASIKSNTMKIEWPYKSGQWKLYPEVDRGEWFSLEDALQKINPAQADFIHELVSLLKT